jgi:hypothetical protein
VYAKLQHAAIQTGKELVTGADSIGWHVQDSLVRMTYGDEVLDAAEWQVKIVSRPTQRSECVRYEGSRYCRIQEGPGQKARFFRPMFRVEGMVICDETGRVMSLVRGRMRWLWTILHGVLRMAKIERGVMAGRRCCKVNQEVLSRSCSPCKSEARTG